MEQKAGAQISQRSFIQSLLILFAMMLLAGILTRLVPAGSYARIEVDGREVVDPASFHFVETPDYPVWRWLTAPLEVLAGPNSAVLITIIVFLFMVGVAFAVLDQSGLLRNVVGRIVKSFKSRKYTLLMVISLFFMAIGALFGVFEEMVPVIPLMIALSYFLGWDALVGLGMSVLAVNMGFSAAITNPFTIGVAQNIAGLPVFSGAWLRLIIFIVVYLVFTTFLVRYARKIERKPDESPVFAEDQAGREKYAHIDFEKISTGRSGRLKRALAWLFAFLILILLLLVAAPFVEVLSAISLPLIGLLFLIGAIGAGLLSGASGKELRRAAWDGTTGIAPAVPLILMAASITYIVSSGGILDTLLYLAAQRVSQASPFVAALLVYFLALFIEVFIGSGSAKAFLIMPVVAPLADLVGITRQTAVTAYCFGDGFSNMLYPTNPVLLISLGLTVVSFPKWLRWSLPLWGAILIVTIVFLGIAVAIEYGPF